MATSTATTGGAHALAPDASHLLKRRPRFQQLGLAIVCDPGERSAALSQALTFSEDWWLTHPIPKEGLRSPSLRSASTSATPESATAASSKSRQTVVRMKVRLGGC
mmetsp:Transcript_109968/g.317942  ORF Transcript_109968/g.317942 Transcript_109968/m.317942 type:complete len:106 (-) Transcript_109968:94-411(-)